MSRVDDPAGTLAERPVVDVDVHPTYRDPVIAEKVADRLDQPYNTYMGDPAETATPFPTDAFPQNIPDKVDITGRLVDVEPELQEPFQDWGIDVAILNMLAQIDTFPEIEWTIKAMRAYNDVLLEHYLDDHDNCYGLFKVTTREPAAAVAEIDRLANEESFVGVLIVNGSSERRLGNERYDPIYDAAANADLPIVFHTGAASHILHPNFPLPAWTFDSYMPIHSLSHPFAHLTTVASLLSNGTPVKFPGLEFIFLEAGLAWVLMAMYRLNRDYGQRRWDAPLLERSPESYIRDQFYFGTQPLDEPDDASDLRRIVDLIGPESIMFGTDHPHFDFDNPGVVIDRYFGHMDDQALNRVLAGNAGDVFGIRV